MSRTGDVSGVEEVLASSALLSLAAEAIDDAHWCESNYTKGCNCREWRERQAGYVLAVVAEQLQPLIRQAQAEALREAAAEAEWKYRSMSFECGVGGTSKPHPVGDFLRARADLLAGDE